MPTAPHTALPETPTPDPALNGDRLPERKSSVIADGFSWVRSTKQLTAMGAIIALAFWQFQELMHVVRDNNAANQEIHKDMLTSTKSVERHMATQVEVTTELKNAVKENTAEVRTTRAAWERVELLLGLGWPFGSTKKP